MATLFNSIVCIRRVWFCSSRDKTYFFGRLSPSGIHLPQSGGRIALGAYQKTRVVKLIEQVGRQANLRLHFVTCYHMSKMELLNITLANCFTDSRVSGAQQLRTLDLWPTEWGKFSDSPGGTRNTMKGEKLKRSPVCPRNRPPRGLWKPRNSGKVLANLQKPHKYRTMVLGPPAGGLQFKRQSISSSKFD